jgi:hypothetical protein
MKMKKKRKLVKMIAFILPIDKDLVAGLHCIRSSMSIAWSHISRSSENGVVTYTNIAESWVNLPKLSAQTKSESLELLDAAADFSGSKKNKTKGIIPQTN